MNNRKFEKIDDTNLMSMFEYSFFETAPEDVVSDVTPWKKSIYRVLLGLVLTTVTLNFLNLDYIFPIIGTVLLLLGFRTLQHENRWFKICFAISIYNTIYLLLSLVIRTTIIQSIFFASLASIVLIIINFSLTIIRILCFGLGFISVQRKAGIPSSTRKVVALIVWYILLCLFALIQYNGLILPILMLIGYFFLIRSMYRLSKELNEAGYAIKTLPIKISDSCIVISLALILILGFICGYMFFSKYPMKWSPLDPEEHKEVEDIKEHLIELGFPEYVLNDLSAEDIAACDGAIKVIFESTDEPVNNGVHEMTKHNNGTYNYYTSQVTYNTKELRITNVGVEVPGKQESWIIFHHFLWTSNPGFCGTESIQLQPVYEYLSDFWQCTDAVSGRVLYDNNKRTLVADYYSLGSQTYTSNSIFLYNQTTTDIFGKFSMPQNGKNHRGYLSYSISELEDGYLLIHSCFNYTHQLNLKQYPAITATESRLKDFWGESKVFKTIESTFKIYLTDTNTQSSD